MRLCLMLLNPRSDFLTRVSIYILITFLANIRGPVLSINKSQATDSVQLISNFVNCIKMKLYNYTVQFYQL